VAAGGTLFGGIASAGDPLLSLEEPPRSRAHHLEERRKGEFEACLPSAGYSCRLPDFGPPALHPTPERGRRRPVHDRLHSNLGTPDVQIGQDHR